MAVLFCPAFVSSSTKACKVLNFSVLVTYLSRIFYTKEVIDLNSSLTLIFPFMSDLTGAKAVELRKS